MIAERVKEAPRVAIGAALVAIVAGIGGNALVMQAGRHPAPLFAPAIQESAAPVEPVAPHAAPAANAAQAAAPQPAAPATTASIGAAVEADRPVAPPQPASGRVEKRAGARAADPIGALLHGNAVDDGSHLVHAAKVALAKLGYPVKPGGAEDGATRRALRHFQHAHGLPETAEISPELVKQLTAAARKQP